MSAQITITGRFVQGGLTLQPKKDNDGKPVLDKESGKPIEECFLAIAVPKNDPLFPQYWAAYNAQARASFPQLFDAAGNCTHPRFAWKLQDGDGIDKNGKSVKDKPGFAGNYVFKTSSRYAPRCYIKDSHGNMTLLENPAAMIKKGYRIAVSIQIDGNGVAATGSGAAVPGLYASANLVLFVAPDEEIISGPDPSEAFAGVATQMPSAAGVPVGVPVGVPSGLTPPALPGAPAGMPSLPGATTAPPALPGAVAAPATPPMPGAAMPTPPMPGGAIPLPPATPTYTMTASAQGATREQLHALGWTDDALVNAGHMIKS
jgi:hypothetical protein